MRIRRETLTTAPPEGDYILSATGYSWNVRRSNGDASVQSIADGGRDKAVAFARVITLAGDDKTDAWETVGAGEFWLLRRFRQQAAEASSAVHSRTAPRS